jgi:c-di-GMP-binding flagellar brake protein YcgR
MQKGEERRKFIRIFLPGQQVRLVSGILLVRIGKVIDISLGGLKFVCSSDFNMGDEISVEVALPSGIKLKCMASICRADQVSNDKHDVIYGAKFVDLSADEQSELGSYIMQQRAEQDGKLSKEVT